jgi:Arc/MetJ-type ribon-helix-helix transcriptional regulator
MTTMGQFVTRIDDDLARAIDDLVEEGVFESRSDAVRQGLAAIMDTHRRTRIGRQIIEGYRKFPETAAEMELAEAVATLMIAAEPWDDEAG